MRALLLVLALVLTPILAAPVWAVEPDEMLDDPVLEARARALSQVVRCPVCQNQPIDSSNAPLARDLRILVRERLVAGDSDAEVKAFLVARYGDYVLFDPPMKLTTYALWFGPALILLLGGFGVFMFFSGARRAPSAPAPLSDEERARLDRLLDAEDDAESETGAVHDEPGGESP